MKALQRKITEEMKRGIKESELCGYRAGVKGMIIPKLVGQETGQHHKEVRTVKEERGPWP